MILITGHPRIWFTVRRLATLIAAVVALGACSSAAGPIPSTTIAVPTNTPVVTPSPTLSATPSPTVAIVKITPIAGAPDSKTVVRLVAAQVRWDPTTLIAPAGKVWHVKIDNKDAPPAYHNFTVASGKTFAERIFQSPNFAAGTFTFDIPALPAGSYLFICTIHPETMTGTLTIK
jgi:plastocyanin